MHSRSRISMEGRCENRNSFLPATNFFLIYPLVIMKVIESFANMKYQICSMSSKWCLNNQKIFIFSNFFNDQKLSCLMEYNSY